MDTRCVVFGALYFLGLICVHGCAGETQERPPKSSRQTHRPETEDIGKSTALPPLPSSAFEGPSSSSSSSVVIADDRFATRSIGGGGESSEGSQVRYHGALVDLDLKEASVHDVFRLLADVGKVNIVVAGEVSGTITMRMKRVPWDQAMEVIARVRGLVYERDGNVIMVRAAGK